MPGDQWQKFANARAFLGYMFTHPGKKLLFMGCDIGTYDEWDSNASVPWDLLHYPIHDGLRAYVRELNRVYREQPALHQVDAEYRGFEWIDFSDVDQSSISFLRRGKDANEFVVVACNFTPVPRAKYAIGVPETGFYRELLNSDAAMFGGSNLGNAGGVTAVATPRHGRPYTITITLPPLAVVVFRPER
jgi:1,4-alpha-glucan branching enzyme